MVNTHAQETVTHTDYLNLPHMMSSPTPPPAPRPPGPLSVPVIYHQKHINGLVTALDHYTTVNVLFPVLSSQSVVNECTGGE